MQDQEQVVLEAINVLELLDRTDPAGAALLSYLYTADSRINSPICRLREYTDLRKTTANQRRVAGELMEEIAYLAFLGLRGVSQIKSYQSAAAQYDLLASGDDLAWQYVCKMLYMKLGARSILVEAKAKKSKLRDRDLSRLLGIMESHLSTSGLAVFFTLNGASGYPTAGKSQRCLQACRLRQVLYYAKTEKPTIVLDKSDIFRLDKNGSLTKIIFGKVRDLAELSALHPATVAGPVEVVLPKHLLKYG